MPVGLTAQPIGQRSTGAPEVGPRRVGTIGDPVRHANDRGSVPADGHRAPRRFYRRAS